MVLGGSPVLSGQEFILELIDLKGEGLLGLLQLPNLIIPFKVVMLEHKQLSG